MRKTNKQILQEELERRILHGLACEWKSALWVLDASQVSLMKRPLIRLSDMRGQLGSWCKEKREICLSRFFVLNHSWDAVREVLIHEMAHQYVSEVMKVGNEVAHGPSFQQACHQLRANPKASGSYMPLQSRLEHEVINSEDKIMLKIKKLMALAESKNQHEADLAMAKSRELIKKYNVDLLKQGGERNYMSVFVGQPALRHFREVYHLSHLLTDFYFVKGLWVQAYVLERGKMGRVLEISGTARNLKIAGYVYDFIIRHIDNQWQAYNKERNFNRYRKTDFAIGVIEGFRSKLEARENQDEHIGNRSLMTVEDKNLLRYIKYRYPSVTRFSRNGTYQDENILAEGMAVGKHMVISKGIAERSDKETFLLENDGP